MGRRARYQLPFFRAFREPGAGAEKGADTASVSGTIVEFALQRGPGFTSAFVKTA